MHACLRCLALCAVLLTLGGCADGPEATVTGQVTLDGQPLETGSINFVPADGATASAGGPITAGVYTLELPPGAKRVEITATRVIGQRVEYAGTPNEMKVNIDESIVPARYNTQSELTFDVQDGENTKDFALTSK